VTGRDLVRIGAAVAVSVGVVGALVPLRGHVVSANLALVLVVLVLAAAVVGGRVVGVVVAVSCALAYDFFLTQPYESFGIAKGEDLQTTLLLALVGVIAGELVERARRSEAAAVARGAQLERTQRRVELAAAGEPPGRLISRSAEELTDLLGVVECRYQPGSAPERLPVLTHNSLRIPAGSTAPPGTVALPVRAHGRDVGYFLLAFPPPGRGIGIAEDTRHEAIALADQLGMALVRYHRP